MLITKRTYTPKEAVPPKRRALVAALVSVPEAEMVAEMRRQLATPWCGLRVDLYHFIDVLNRVDGVLGAAVKKYRLAEDTVPLVEVSDEDSERLSVCLQYTYYLLEYSNNKSVYSSAEHVYALVRSSSLAVRAAALNVTCLLCERFGANEGRPHVPQHTKRLILRTIRSFPPLVSKAHLLRHVSLVDCMSDADWPAEWRSLNFEYFGLKKKRSGTGAAVEGLHHFRLSAETVAKLSAQQIYDRARDVVPEEKWSDFEAAVAVAKAYCEDTSSSVHLRRQLVVIKCLCVAAAAACCNYNDLANTVFDEEPYLLSYMSDLVSPANEVDEEASFAALRAFVNISSKGYGLPDLMRAWGGNVSQSLLFELLRHIEKKTREGEAAMPKTYMNYVFNMVANFMGSSRFVGYLRSAGLMNIFLELLKMRSNFRMTRSGPLHLIQLFVRACPDVLDDFIAASGFTVLIDLLQYEVDFAISDPGFGGGAPVEDAVDLSFAITVRQVKTINFLLKLVNELITNHSGDRMRNLYDSPILQSLIKIMENPRIFGYDLLTSVLRIFVGIINSEPTAYAILEEGHMVDCFFAQFDSLLGCSSDLLMEIPESLSAIALNHGGHKRILDERLIPRFFTIFKDEKIAAELLREENAMAMGQEIDELARHHPGLKTAIDEEVLTVLREASRLTHFEPTLFFQSRQHGSLYHSKSDEVVFKEEGGAELVTWDASPDSKILDCVGLVVSIMFENSRIWKNLFKRLPMDDLLRIICVADAPFDYVSSSGLYSVSSIIKSIDQELACCALSALRLRLMDELEAVSAFTHFARDDVSYFDQFDVPEDAEKARKGGEMLAHLGTINCLLFIMSDVYGSPNKIPSPRVSGFAEQFQTEDGLRLVRALLDFYRRVALEEVLMHTRTPLAAAKDVVSVNQGVAKYHVEIGPQADKPARDGTSAKFKNLRRLFFHFARQQSWMRHVFSGLCRASNDRRQDVKYGMVPKWAVKTLIVYVDRSVELISSVTTTNDEVFSGFTLLMLNQLYSSLFMRSRPSDPLNAALVIVLLQNGGLKKLGALAAKFFRILLEFPADVIADCAKSKTVHIATSNTAFLVLSQVLSIFTGVSTKSLISFIPAQERFYPDLTRNLTPYYHELSHSILVQTSQAAFHLLESLFDDEDLLGGASHPERIPELLVEKLIVISRNFYTAVSTTQSHVFEGRLYPLSYRNTSPSSDKIEYLESLGIDGSLALEVITFYRNSLDAFLADGPAEMIEEVDGAADNVDWAAVARRAKETPFHAEQIAPIPNSDTLDDLNFSRGAHDKNFVAYWIRMAQLFPKSTTKIADLLVSVCTKTSYMFFSDVVNAVYSTAKETADPAALSRLYQLLACLMDEKSINKNAGFADEVVPELVAKMVSQDTVSLVTSASFPGCMQAVEKFVAHSKLPKSPEVDAVVPAYKFPDAAVIFPQNWMIDTALEESLFRKLLEIEDIPSSEAGEAVVRMLILMTDSYQRCRDVYQSGVLTALLGCVRAHLDDSALLQGHVISLIRRCMEDDATVRAYIDGQVDSVLKKGAYGSQLQVPSRDMSSVVKENAALVIRDDEAYIDSLSSKAILYQCQDPIRSLGIVPAKEDTEVKLVSPPPPYSTGIVHLLVSELMAVTKKDLVTSTADQSEDSAKDQDSIPGGMALYERDEHDPMTYSKEEMFRNKDLGYALFLLQTLTELLMSYKQAKTEFLTFSRKQSSVYTLGKPRPTALSVLIHRLMFSDPFNKGHSVALKRRRLLSQMAGVCVFGLVSTVPQQSAKGTKVDPDMTFVRKFTVDVFIKAISGETGSAEKYGKITDLVNVVRRILKGGFLNISAVVDPVATKNDDYFFAKELLDKKFCSLLTGLLGELDLNFPHTEEAVNAVMRCLTCIGDIKVKNQELFKESAQPGEGDEEMYNEEEVEGVAPPDLLRNSTLGMYDVDELAFDEDEDEDDEILSEDGEILNEDDIDIVYSDEEMSEGDTIGEENSEEDEEGEDSEGEGDSSSSASSASDIVVQSEPDYDDGSDIVMSDSDLEMIDEEGFDGYPLESESDDQSEDSESGEEEESDDSADSVIVGEWMAEHERQHHANARRLDELEPMSRGLFSGFSGDSSDEEETFHFRRHFGRGGAGGRLRAAGHRMRFDNLEIVPPPVAGFARDADNPLSLIDLTVMRRNLAGVTNALRVDPNAEGLAFNMAGQFSVGGATLADFLRALDARGSVPRQHGERVPNVFMESTLQRWLDTALLFFSKSLPREACRVVPTVVNNIYSRSLAVNAKRMAERKELLRQRAEAVEKKRQEQEERIRQEQEAARQTIEPVYVTIGGSAINIAGTRMDPEFIQALPEDMRGDVFVQYVREERLRAASSGEHVRELDPEFVDALPDLLRDSIAGDGLVQTQSLDPEDVEAEAEAEVEAELDRAERAERAERETSIDASQNSGAAVDRRVDAKTQGGAADAAKKKSRVFFPVMVDRVGVAAMVKMVFVPLLYMKREAYFTTVALMCYNKHTRSEMVALLLYILQEGLREDASLETLYHHLCTRADPKGTAGESRRLPIGCTTLSMATEAIDVLHYLLEKENHVRFHFLLDQEATPLMKKVVKRGNADASYRYPINVLLSLLENKLVKEDTNLMDTLSRAIQVATGPLKTMNKKSSAALPVIPDRNLRLVVDVLVADECASKVFQQTIASIQNLSVLENARQIFPHELSSKATELSAKIARDLRDLVAQLHDGGLVVLDKFSSSSSDQAKLLRVLTALDYLFQGDEGLSELTELYRNSALGPLWGALSDCLKLLRQRDDLQQVTTILSPLIEALMVVCKHSRVEKLPVRDVLRYKEETAHNFENEPIESLFFSFTSEHKKILNQMIRNSPKLMSGPFAVLVRNPKVLEFDNKRVYFQQKLHKDDKKPVDGGRPEPTHDLSISVKRDQVFLDSYRALFFKSPEVVRKSNLEVKFQGEEGVDAGGLTREWYQVLSRQIFNPDYALFTPVTSDKTTFHPNRASWVNPEHLTFFKFVGMIIAKAVYDGYLLDCHFTRAVFKRILGKSVSLKDMESLDPDYYKSLVWMLENPIGGIIEDTFSLEADDYGEHKVIDLKPNGRNIAVTDDNKQEYVKLNIEYKLIESVKDQLDNFLQGFYEIIPEDLVAIFDERELELLISGMPDINVDDWKNNTVYVNYSASSPQIQWFWRAVKSFDKEERAKLLQFATGTSKVPLNGFKELSGVNGVSKFSIHRVYGDTDRLPSAHTCFNQIDLPEYETYDKLRAAVLLAVREGHEGFGFA